MAAIPLPVGSIFGHAPAQASPSTGPGSPGGEIPELLRRACAALYLHEIEPALEGFDAAAERALERDDTDAFRLCLVGKALAYYHRNAFDAAAKAIQRADSGEVGDPDVAAAVKLAQARVWARAGRKPEADAALADAQGLVERSRDEALWVELALARARAFLGGDRRPEALEAFREAQAASERVGSAMGLGRSLRGLAILASLERSADAVALARRALAAFQSAGYAVGQVETHLTLGRAYFAAGELEQAEFHFREADRLCAARRIVQAQPEAQSRLGDVHAARGDYNAALESYRRARSLLPPSGGDPRALGWIELGIGRLKRLLGNPTAAEQDLLASAAAFRQAGAQRTLGLVLLEFGRALLDTGRRAEALERVKEAREIFRDRPLDLAAVDFVEGMARRAAGEFERARTLLVKARRAQESGDPAPLLAEIHHELALLEEAQGDRDAALRALKQAIRSARMTRVADLEAKYLEALGRMDMREWMKTAYEVLVVAPDEYENFLRGAGRVPTEVTTLFVDIRGYTSLSEQLGSEAIAEVINEYLDLMSRTALKHGGRVVDFYGDGVLAVFGLDGEHQPRDAVLAALAMTEVIGMLNDRKKASLPRPLAVGVGVHTGRVVAGFFGSQQRRKFTVIGDPVNVASRLSANAGGGEVLASRATWERLADRFLGEPRGPLAIKGRAEPVDTTRVIGARP